MLLTESFAGWLPLIMLTSNDWVELLLDEEDEDEVEAIGSAGVRGVPVLEVGNGSPGGLLGISSPGGR